MRRLAIALATSGGAGLVPVAPGTAGSALGVVVYMLTRHWPSLWQVGLLCAVSAAGTWAADEAVRYFGRKDPSQVVIDEVAGQLTTLLLTGVGWLGALVGFALFRALDVVKPWPARQFEALPGGVGVMADDLMAGAYGWLLLQVVIRAVPWAW